LGSRIIDNLNNDVRSILLHDNIWALLTSCDTTESSHGHAVNNPLQPFRGHLDTLVDQSVINDIEYLVIGFALFEPQVNSNHTSWIEDCLHYCKTSNLFPNLKSVYVLYENTYINFTSLTDHYPTYGVRLNYFLLRSEGTEEKAIGIDNSYDNTWFRKAEVNLGFNYNKAVWMIGDITNRPHKFPLLYKFHTENKLDVLDYSLTYRLNDQTNEHFREDNYNSLIDWMNELYDLDLDLSKMKTLYHTFAKEFEGDQFGKMIEQHVNSFDIANYVFPPAYNDARLIINPETWWRQILTENYPEDSQSFSVTEKTWKPIAVKKPFIGISCNDMLDRHLESLGFRTFRKYTNHPNNLIVDVQDLEQYITVAYERVVSFLKNSHSRRQEIWEDIEHNHAQWQKILTREWDLLYQKCPPFKHVNKDKILRAFCLPYEPQINQKDLTFPPA